MNKIPCTEDKIFVWSDEQYFFLLMCKLRLITKTIGFYTPSRSYFKRQKRIGNMVWIALGSDASKLTMAIIENEKKANSRNSHKVEES